MADKIIKWNLKRYPDGVFFLFGAGRLALCQSQPEKAIAFYTHAMEAQSQYRNLHHVSFWEIAVAKLALMDFPGGLAYWRDLEKEATVSHLVCLPISALIPFGLVVKSDLLLWSGRLSSGVPSHRGGD